MSDVSEGAIIKLRNPIQFGKRVVDELVFREPTAGDFRGLEMKDGFTMDAILTMASRLSGQPDAVINKVKGAADIGEVIRVVAVFMPGGLATGEAPSP